MNYPGMDKDQLWKSVLDGDEDALRELLQRLDGVILAESRLFGHVDEDVAQDIREKLIKAIRKELGCSRE